MSEQACAHNYSGGVWTVTLRNGDMIVGAHGCPDCLTRLEDDGSETPMVPAALSQSAGLAAAESQTTLSAVVCAAEELALHAYPAPDERPGLGKTAWFLLPHDEKLSRWITILNRRALAAVGAPTTERADGPGGTELRPTVRWFAERMELALREHDADRGETGWRELSIPHLVERLLQEAIEVEAARGAGGEVLVAECADVANIAMMVADNAARQPAPTGEGKPEEADHADAE